MYIVEEIQGERFANGRIEFLVKWKGYSVNDNTWEPLKGVQKTDAYNLWMDSD
jgi:hypothetical protein